MVNYTVKHVLEKTNERRPALVRPARRGDQPDQVPRLHRRGVHPPGAAAAELPAARGEPAAVPRLRPTDTRPYEDLLGTITVPVRLLWGRHDRILPPEYGT